VTRLRALVRGCLIFNYFSWKLRWGGPSEAVLTLGLLTLRPQRTRRDEGGFKVESLGRGGISEAASLGEQSWRC
jgi:hypothetical protein